MRALLVLIFLFCIALAINAMEIPLIDREIFFGNPEILNGNISPDGKQIAFLKAHEGIMNVWVKKIEDPFSEARLLTDSKTPLYSFFWTYDSRYILYVTDNDGDENMNIFAVSLSEKPKENSIPRSRNLTPFENIQARIYMVSRNNPDILMIGLNKRDPAWHDLYKLSVSTGDLELLYENTNQMISYKFDWDDNLRLFGQVDNDGNSIILAKTEEGVYPVYETNSSEQSYILGWNEDNSAFYIVSNKGDVNLLTLYLLNPLTKEIKKIESDPEDRVDFGNIWINRNTRKIIKTEYVDDRTRHYWQDEKYEALYNDLKEKFPGREIHFTSSSNDYSKLLISVWGDRYYPDYYLYDIEKKELIHQFTPRQKLKEIEKYMAEMKPVRYRSSDGLEIPAYLTIPAGAKQEKLPLIVLVHGGPKGARDFWEYDPVVQFLANRGYAVLQPNFRASGGYGKAFMNAGDLEWGRLMQDDLTWGVKHLIEQGIADPEKIAVCGTSYGGYAALAGLAFTPDLYACGISIVGPSNIFTLLESIPPYWESIRQYLYAMTGDPNTEEGWIRIQEASPLFHVDKMNRPLLVVQGANDPRVKQAESDQIVAALREKGKQVSYLLADDEGHGFAKPVNRMAMYFEIERFLAEILGGRYQEDIPEEVEKRLKEIRVDI